jgi:hypothetical protein
MYPLYNREDVRVKEWVVLERGSITYGVGMKANT